MLKYEFTGTEKKVMYDGVEETFRSIRALRDIPAHGVKSGDIGGWVSLSSDLSQEGEVWVSGHSHLYKNSNVSGNVLIHESNIYESSIHGEGVIHCSNVFGSNMKNTDFNNVEHAVLSDIKTENALLELDTAIIKHLDIADTVFKVKNSTLKSVGACPLVITTNQKRFIMNNSKIFVDTEHPDHARVHHYVKIQNVHVLKDEPLKMMVGFEPFVWENLNLKNMSMYHGHLYPSKENGNSSLSGSEDKSLSLEDAYFQSQGSYVKGDIRLEGNLMLEKSTIEGMSSLVNHGKGELSLRNIRLTEMASITKESEFALELQNKSYGAEDVVVLG